MSDPTLIDIVVEFVHLAFHQSPNSSLAEMEFSREDGLRVLGETPA